MTTMDPATLRHVAAELDEHERDLRTLTARTHHAQLRYVRGGRAEAYGAIAVRLRQLALRAEIDAAEAEAGEPEPEAVPWRLTRVGRAIGHIIGLTLAAGAALAAIAVTVLAVLGLAWLVVWALGGQW